MKHPFVQSLLICLPIFGLLLALVRWNPHGDFWKTVESPKAQCEAYDPIRTRTLTSLSDRIYDQVKLDRLVREPQNTVSNLPYATVGLAILIAGHRRITKGLGLGCIFLAVGSGIYHASLLPEWRLVDILGVYVALFSLLAFGAATVIRAQQRDSSELFVVSCIWITGFESGIHRNDVRIAGFKVFDSTYVVVAAIAAGSALALFAFTRTANRRRYFIAAASLAVFAPLAFAGGLGDRYGGFLASPDALIQGHSIWHACGAAALLAAYEIFASTGFERSVFSSRNVNNSPEIAH
jgi:hypothetical protein